jgi:DNA (cytosine-5)-methyltransferase 1
MMTHGSLFSGIEGFGEGAERAGQIETIFHVEENKFCHDIIRKLSNAPIFSDIRTFDGHPYCGKVNIISGGFPCQDISKAGNGIGISGQKSGLWSHFARIIAETRPDWVIIENSSNLARKGLERVLFDLAQVGYDAEWQCISAAAFGMPHERERLFVIAYAHTSGWAEFLRGYPTSIFKAIQQTGPWQKGCEPSAGIDPVLQFRERIRQPALFGVADGISKRSHLMPRLAAVGNSVSPVIAEYLFHCIKFAQNVADEFQS